MEPLRRRSPHRIIGESPQVLALRDRIARIAASPASTVFITGESGTGKDLVAKVIHESSVRRAHPFMNITCSALPEQLLETELFGHERGAFTDAGGQHRGLLENANGGTVFLDEVSEMTPTLQAKLLRFLEDRSFRRVGGERDVHVSVRIIAASNRNMEREVANGHFRADLYYRLNVVPVWLSPLRSRLSDIPLLVNHFIDGLNEQFGRGVKGLTAAAWRLFGRYGWPGNIRELRNVLERAVVLTLGAWLDSGDFPGLQECPYYGAIELPPDGLRLEDLERSLVRQALRLTRGNRTQAGHLLGLNRDQVRHRIEKLALQADFPAAAGRRHA